MFMDKTVKILMLSRCADTKEIDVQTLKNQDATNKGLRGV